MPQIAIICKTLLKGGAEKQALMLAKSLIGKNIGVCLINWNQRRADPENLRFIKDNSIKYIPLSGNFLIKLFKVGKIMKEEKVTFIVSYLTLANLVAGITKIFNKKIKTIGGIRNEKLPYYKFVLEKFIHNYVNNLTVFNNFSGEEKFTNRGFKADKIVVIQNAIDFDNHLIDAKTFRSEVIKIISVGRFVKQKDYHTALISFKLLIEGCKNRTFKYLIAGYGPMENEIRLLAGKLNISSSLEILINPPDIPNILKECDIFLSTSLFEGVSNSIMEAMVTGLPVVATKVGDNHFLVKDGINGYLVPCKNVEAIAEKLEYLSESEKRRNEFGRNSRSIIENDFSKEKLVESYIRLFSKLE